MEEYEKISRTIYEPVRRQLSLELHVKLMREHNGRTENFHNTFMYAGKNYMRVDLQSFLTLKKTDGPWSKDKSVLIDQSNIYQLIKGLEKAIDVVYNGDIFALNREGKSIMYADKVEENTIDIFNLGYNNRIQIKPAIIYDENDVTYEGVVLYINRTANYVELPIDALEALYYTLKQTNLFVESQLLLNYYLAMVNLEKKAADEKTDEEKPKVVKKTNIFVKPQDNKVEEEVKSVGTSKTEPDIMDGIGDSKTN